MPNDMSEALGSLGYPRLHLTLWLQQAQTDPLVKRGPHQSCAKKKHERFLNANQYMIVKANEQKLHQWRHLVSPPRQGKSLAVGLSVRALAAQRTLPSSWQIRSCRLSRGLRDCVETKHKDGSLNFVCLNFVTVELLCLNREEPSMPLVLHPQRLENSWPLPRAEPVEQTRLHGFDEPRHSNIWGRPVPWPVCSWWPTALASRPPSQVAGAAGWPG